MNQLYGDIDLHANNSVIVLVDNQEQVVYEKRILNDLEKILFHLHPYQNAIHGLVIESTYFVVWPTQKFTLLRSVFPEWLVVQQINNHLSWQQPDRDLAASHVKLRKNF